MSRSKRESLFDKARRSKRTLKEEIVSLQWEIAVAKKELQDELEATLASKLLKEVENADKLLQAQNCGTPEINSGKKQNRAKIK